MLGSRKKLEATLREMLAVGRADSLTSGSIMERDTADRCQVGPSRPSCSRIAVSVRQVIPNSCKVSKTVY